MDKAVFDCSRVLSTLSHLAEDESRIVAWRGHEPLSADLLVGEAGQWQARFDQLPPAQALALYFHDSFSAAAALLGAWHAGRTVILPGDAQAATLQRLQQTMAAHLIGDMPGAERSPPSGEHALSGTLSPDQAALVIFTSGSSGEPVAINKTLGQICSEVAAHADLWMGELRGRSVVASVSHQHIYGLIFRLLLPLVSRCPFMAERLEYPEQIRDVIARRPAILVSSPAFLKRLPEGEPWDSSPGIVFSSGGPLSAEAAQQGEIRLATAIIEVYGSSETGGIGYRRQTQTKEWTALPQVQLDVDAGLLTVRSPYTQAHDWHRTSDQARLGEHGFELLGRADRLVKIEEKRVSLDGIENVLLASPLVADVKVIVLAGPRTRLGAVVVLAPGGLHALQTKGKRAVNEELRQLLLMHIERVALPRYWRYVEALPVNLLGKTTQASLKALFEPTHDSRYPRILSREQQGAAIELKLVAEPDLPWFDGHFPDLPILPGVAILQWVEHFARLEFPLPPDFMRMDIIKFQRVVRPGMVVRLHLEWLTERRAVVFKASSAAGPHASGRMAFGDAPA